MACDSQLQTLHQDACELHASCRPAAQQQQSKQHKRRHHSARLNAVWDVMGMPSVTVLMALLRWHTLEEGLRCALQCLDIARYARRGLLWSKVRSVG